VAGWIGPERGAETEGLSKSLPHMLFHQSVQSCPEVIGVERVAIAEDDGAAIAAEVEVVTVLATGGDLLPNPG